MAWVDGARMRRIEKLGLSKAELGMLEEAFSQVAAGLEGKREPDPVVACRGSPMLQCDMVQRIVAGSSKMGVGAQDAAVSMCLAFDELCSLSLDGGWIREEDSHWADRDPAAHALYNDMPKLAMLLARRGASCDAALHDGEPMVVWFAKNAGTMLQEFLDLGPDLNARGRAGGTFLHHLSWLHKFDGEQPLGLYRRVVSKAKARGMDIDVRDHEGRSPLHWAAQMADLALAQSLVEAGADPLARSSAGLAPWEEAGGEKVAEYLEAAALAAREAADLGEMGRERERLAGGAALELLARGLLSVGGRPVRDLAELLEAHAKAKREGSEGAKRL